MSERVLPKPVPILLFAGAMAVGAAAFGQASHHLAGRWSFDRNQSDDASQKVHDAQASIRRRGRNSRGGGGGYPGGVGYPGGGYPGGGYPGGIGVGIPGRIGVGIPGSGGMGRSRRGPGGRERERNPVEGLEQLAANPKVLTIRQDEKKIEIFNNNGGLVTLFPDGKKHKERDASGNKVTLKSHWQGDQLVSKHKVSHLGKLKETYELSPDGRQLFVTTELDNSHLDQPLIIRRVYDSARKAAASAKK